MRCYESPEAYRAAQAPRFWLRVDRSGDCWRWTGTHKATGYGRLSWGGRRAAPAHRVAWELTHGVIPDGVHVLHRCDNPTCVNPAHLFLGTHADNMSDRREKGRYAGLRSEACRRGHAFTEASTIVRKNGSRQCRICRNAAARAKRAELLANPTELVECDSEGSAL